MNEELRPIPYPIEPAPRKQLPPFIEVGEVIEYFGPLALKAWEEDYVTQWGEP